MEFDFLFQQSSSKCNYIKSVKTKSIQQSNKTKSKSIQHKFKNKSTFIQQ